MGIRLTLTSWGNDSIHPSCPRCYTKRYGNRDPSASRQTPVSAPIRKAWERCRYAEHHPSNDNQTQYEPRHSSDLFGSFPISTAELHETRENTVAMVAQHQPSHFGRGTTSTRAEKEKLRPDVREHKKRLASTDNGNKIISFLDYQVNVRESISTHHSSSYGQDDSSSLYFFI
jgi:hypothetical protein